MDFNEKEFVTSEEELRELIGFPAELVERKTIPHVDEQCSAFIARSPFVLLSTSDAAGACDVSPRGDAAGFVKVWDEKRLLIPERPGNKRMDSLRNILSNPQVGLLFMIPGLGETLRINGRACITKDQALLEEFGVQGKTPQLGIIVTVEECYVHCAKAIRRSHLWDPASWPAREALPSAARMIAVHAKLEGWTEEAIEARLAEGYSKRLY